VLPQVRVAWTGISIYTWDAAFRAATVVGFFGAGGMGWYLRRTVQQIQSTRVAAILISIIFLVVISEVVSAWARNKVGKTYCPALGGIRSAGLNLIFNIQSSIENIQSFEESINIPS
jgi:hypothetical protein